MLDALMPAFRPANGCALIRNNSEDKTDNKNIVPALEPMDRYGLVVDLFAVDFKFVFESYFKFWIIFQAVRIGRMPISVVLNLYRQAVSECENSYVVWSALDNVAEQIAMVLDCIEIEDEGRLKGRFQLFICNILAPILNLFSEDGWAETNTHGK